MQCGNLFLKPAQFSSFQKQLFKGILWEICFENFRDIYMKLQVKE